MCKKKYIYNYEQAYYFMENGVMPCERPQVHFISGDIFFVFDKTDKLEELYVKWNKRER